LLLAILPFWPYGYFTMLRLIICVVGGYIAYQCYQREILEWQWAFIIIALLYNPIIPVGLPRGLWIIVNLITAGVLYFYKQRIIYAQR